MLPGFMADLLTINMIFPFLNQFVEEPFPAELHIHVQFSV